MINFLEITKSRLRQKLLTYFFTNPSASLYVREIASLLSVDPGNVSKELVKLKNSGILKSSVSGNQKYFSLNTQYPLYKELKSIIFKTTGAEGALRDIINNLKGVIVAFIYGSFANNRQNHSSDIDLLIVGSVNNDVLMGKIESLEKKLQREINYNVYSKVEFAGRIKAKDSFIMNLLDRPKIMLKGSIDEFR
jgi:predicted nucleotidyltransferase/predicted transcriptional regulator with HTH domain